MKLAAALLPILAFISTAAAQASYIRYPQEGATVRGGRRTTVQLARPNSIMGSQEAGLALSFQYCGNDPCPDATQRLGSVTFIGQYDPQLHEIPGEPYQNFTVTIPDLGWENGPGEIIATRFHLIGAGPAPVLETNRVKVYFRK